ncbi:Heavy metal-associated domain superfamily [Arabidopsis thaliana x Arabidopsis arenosa]|uniref:Heavy metal-associated domain superfamily n=1 Tax=Arabidopsis thaliana x Arabidopsis arenosa TaxID=1240361 RepID=A0A8T1YZJ2_9BRAS|nr:Heavy metal-associated domain superfamily [Arabidopsis thaliana x Arabidopsis arenosa]
MGEEVKPEAKEAVSAPEAVPAEEKEKKKDVAEEKKVAADEEKPTEEEEPQPPPPPPPFILYVDLHCVGCAKKIERSILKIRGVEEVVMDMNENQVTIKGVLDPQAVCNKIKKKTKRMAKVLSPLPAAEGEPLPPIITSQVSGGLTTVELNVNMHCEACADQLKKKILKMRGVQTTVTEHTTGKVIVTGTMDAEKLVDYVYRRTKKQARIVPQPDPEPENPAAEEEKKEENGDGDEKPPETGEDKEEEKKKEGEGNQEEGGGEDAADTEGDRRDDEMAAMAEVEGMKRMMYYYQPSYVIERIPPPQLFSDENPNACCIS